MPLFNPPIAVALATTGDPVYIDTSAPPIAGYALVATSPTAAEWQAVAGGGGNEGSGLINFGATLNSITTVSVADPTITAGANIQAWIMAETGGDYNAISQAVIASRTMLACGAANAGVGFEVAVISDLKLFGNVAFRWAWTP